MKSHEGRFGLCIVGCGNFARIHAAAARRYSDIALYFASRSKDRALAYAREYGGAGGFGSYEEAARDPRVDALIICTPHALHREHFELAAAWGKATLIEKPLATTSSDARAMIQRAKETRIPLMVAENVRYIPVVQTTAILIHQGAIGQVLSIHIQEAKYQRSTGWRLSRSLMGGGALMDGGIHKLSILRLLLGDPKTVAAVAHPKIFPEMEGEEGVSLWASFLSGAVGTLTYTWNAGGDEGSQTFLATGDQGTLMFSFYGDEVRVTSPSSTQTIPANGDSRGIEQMQDSFLELVRHGKPTQTPPVEGLRDLEFVLAAYASIDAEGSPISLPPFTAPLD